MRWGKGESDGMRKGQGEREGQEMSRDSCDVMVRRKGVLMEGKRREPSQ